MYVYIYEDTSENHCLNPQSSIWPAFFPRTRLSVLARSRLSCQQFSYFLFLKFFYSFNFIFRLRYTTILSS